MTVCARKEWRRKSKARRRRQLAMPRVPSRRPPTRSLTKRTKSFDHHRAVVRRRAPLRVEGFYHGSRHHPLARWRSDQRDHSAAPLRRVSLTSEWTAMPGEIDSIRSHLNDLGERINARREELQREGILHGKAREEAAELQIKHASALRKAMDHP